MRQEIATLVAGLLLAAGARAAEPVAQIFSVQGTARAGERDVAAGDELGTGDVVRTDGHSRLALFAAEVYVQLDPDSALRVDRDAGGAVRLELQSGRARLVDTRETGGAAVIAAGGAEAAIAGGDSEIYLLSEKTGRYAMFCEWDGPLSVAKGPQALVAEPGSCVLVKPGEPPYTASGHEHQIPLLPPGEAAPSEFLAGRFDTPPVGAGPFHGFPGPADAPDRERDPCDIPGTGCSGAQGLEVIDPPPDTDFCAPGMPCYD